MLWSATEFPECHPKQFYNLNSMFLVGWFTCLKQRDPRVDHQSGAGRALGARTSRPQE